MMKKTNLPTIVANAFCINHNFSARAKNILNIALCCLAIFTAQSVYTQNPVNNQWYLAYHYEVDGPYKRTKCIDSLFYNEDRSIQLVIPSTRGIAPIEKSR